MPPDTKSKIQARLKRVAGQISGIQRMVESDRYCVDVLMQIAAVRAALGQVSKQLLHSHLLTCVVEAFERPEGYEHQTKDTKDAKDTKISELVRVFEKSISG